MKTKVLFVSTSTTLGGAEKTLFALATGLGPEVDVAGVVSLKPEGEYARRLREKGVRVESLGLSGLPRPSHVRALAAIIDRERPDVVHALMYQAIQLCRLAKARTCRPFRLLSSPRVSYRTRSFASLAVDRCLRHRDDLLVAESAAGRDFLVGPLAYSSSKVAVIRNGVDAPPSPPPGARAARRAELGLAEDRVLVGAVGRLDAQKGFDVLLEAMARLKGVPVSCAIVGDGPAREELAALSRSLGVEGSARLLGEADAAAWRPAFDVFVLPSRWEGLPNALLESMAAGLPCVASAVDGVLDVVRDGIDGLLVPPDDPAELAEALAALAAGPAPRARLAQAARTRAAEFTVRGMLDAYRAAYASLRAD